MLPAWWHGSKQHLAESRTLSPVEFYRLNIYFATVNTIPADNKNKVLIVAYYWPPSGGSGVQRWLKFVKYLPQSGWKPYVFTPENPSFAIRDSSLAKDVPAEAEVIRFPIWEPYDAFFKLSGIFGSRKSAKPTDLVAGKASKEPSAFQRLSTWIRGNLFIPDPRVFWVRPSVRFLDTYLRQHGIHTIITTGPPHSMHLIGYRLKQLNPALTWVADFRDPWSEWGFLDTLGAGKRARRRHTALERKVITTADKVLTITPFYVRRFEALSGRKVDLLTNGYDADDFAGFTIRRTNKFIIRHVGIVNEKCDPRPFMRAVQALMDEHGPFAADVLVDFTGEVHPSFRAFVEDIPALAAVTSFTASVPHKELIGRYSESAALLLVLTGYKDAEGYMPGKLFEYLATGLPVLGSGPAHGDAATLLQETNAGRMVEGDDTVALKRAIQETYEGWRVPAPAGHQPIDRCSRRKLTEDLVQILSAAQR